MPIWGIPVWLVYAPRRVWCVRCEGVHVEALPWAVGTQRFTRALLVTIATWTRVLPWQQVATLFGVPGAPWIAPSRRPWRTAWRTAT